MPNLILLCHGSLKEFSSFELKREKQSVVYRGNFGAVLEGDAAKQLVSILRNDPYPSEEGIKRAIPNYSGSEEMTGPGSFGPDIDLWGDDNLLCFIMDMSNGRWARLGSGWRAKLSEFVAGGDALYLNLLCCTLLKGSNVEAPRPDPRVEVKNWKDLL